jgi:hypothetical protein
MDATWIITAFVVIDPWMERLGHRTPPNPLERGGLAGRWSTVSVPPNARADPSVS